MERRKAYIVGVALGDGNLSSPNGRATRLRITCDARYLCISEMIQENLKELFPKNAVSIVRKPGVQSYFNISVYSNRLDDFMPWRVGFGTKEEQNAHVPDWIKQDPKLLSACLLGLFQTDGSVYVDRGYLMVNFCNNVRELAEDVYTMVESLGFRPTITSTPSKHGRKYTVRIARRAAEFIETIGLAKK